MFNGQVTIKIKNYTSYKLSAELFNYNSSFLFIKNPNYSLAPYNYCPVGTYEGLNNLIQAYLNPPPPPPAPPFPLGIVTFNASGSAQIFGNYNWPTMVIETDDLCYRSLFESSKSTFFIIDGIRLQVNYNSQLENPIVFFKQTFLGARIENQINPLAWLQDLQRNWPLKKF